MGYYRRQELACTEEEYESLGRAVLLKDEVIYIKQGDRYAIKIGDGVTKLCDLPFVVNFSEIEDVLEDNVRAVTDIKNEASTARDKAEEAKEGAEGARAAAEAAQAAVSNKASSIMPVAGASRLIHIEDSADDVIQELTVYGMSTPSHVPSPWNKAKISNICDDGALELISVGDNLLNVLGSVPVEKSGITYESFGDGTIWLNGTCTMDNTCFDLNQHFKLPEGKYYLLIEQLGGTGRVDFQLQGMNTGLLYTSSSRAFTVPASGMKRGFGIRLNEGFTVNNYLVRVSVFAGEAPCPHKPYTESCRGDFSGISSLRGIPVPKGGNVIINGQQYISDTVTFTGDMIRTVRRIGVIDLKGCTAEHMPASGDHQYMLKTSAGYPVLTVASSAIMCDAFKTPCREWGPLENEMTYSGDDNMQIRLTLSVDPDKINSYFASNNVLLYYVLDEPEVTVSTADGFIYTSKPISNIYNINGAYISAKYVADTKFYNDLKALDNSIIRSASGTLVHIEDGSEQALKSLSVYGKSKVSGTPTPSTPRNITGNAENGELYIRSCGDTVYEHTGGYAERQNCDAGGYPLTLTNDETMTLPAGKYYLNLYADVKSGDIRINALPRTGDDRTVVNGISRSDNLNWGLNSFEFVLTETTDICIFGQLYSITSGEVHISRAWISTAEGSNLPYTANYSAVGITAPLQGVRVDGGGNVTVTGVQYAADKLTVFKDGSALIERHAAKCTVTMEALNVTKESDKDGYIVWCIHNALSADKYIGEAYPISNKFSSANNTKANAEYQIYFRDEWGDVYVSLPDSVAGTAEEAKAAIGESFDIVVGLRTPIYETLTAEQLKASSVLHTYKPITNIFTEDGAYIEAEYIADTKTYIDNQFTELRNAVLAQGGNI